MDFTFKTYENLLNTLLSRGFSFLTFTQYIEAKFHTERRRSASSLESLNLESSNLDSSNPLVPRAERFRIESSNLESLNLESLNLESLNPLVPRAERFRIESSNLESLNL